MASKPKPRLSIDARDHVWAIKGKTYAFASPMDTEAYYYDADEGQYWIDLIQEWFCHTEGDLAGQPLILMPWAEAVTRQLFGWRKKEDGFRRYQTFHYFVPGKNGKTQLGACYAQGLTGFDDEQGAQIFWQASTEEQAKGTCFKMISDMHTLNADLGDVFELQKSSLALYHPETRSLLRVLSSLPTGGIHGPNVQALILDEPHESPRSETRDVLRNKMITRNQPLLGYISTAGKNRECWYYKEYEYLTKLVAHEEHNDRYLAFCCEPKKGADPADLRTWKDANPGMGISVKVENLKTIFEESQSNPSKMDMFLQTNLNMWIERTSDFINYQNWELCAQKYTMKDLRGKFCIGGFDLSQARDFTSFALCFPNWQYDETGSQETAWRLPLFLVWYWIPQAVYDSTQLYHQWSQYIEITKGDYIDKALIKRRIKEIRQQFNCKKAYFDPWHSLDIFSEMEEPDVFEVTSLRQNFQTMGPAVNEISNLIVAGKIGHNNNPVLNWNVRNAKVETSKDKNKETLKILRKAKDALKIDGLVACCIAYCGSTFEAAPPQASVYEERGIEIW